jgi:membrane protein implicated in regulation of membrane protease activity
MVMTWWMWFLLGLLLLGAELITPGGFFIFFFGCGAVVVGIVELLGLPLSTPLQVLLFVAVSIVSLLIFRKPLKERFAHMVPSGQVDSLVGEFALALEEIPAGGLGKVELRGSTWNAENLGPLPVARSARCRVERVEGLTLFIRS